ncbi:TIGR03087 family PEP-CTERM/XrtA system glycosyltransferase [Catenovulum sp. SM1970]|uniref:TIGR03087 family PEP-CTERM/XrtA system glycosyltransferase n=1 Tax=Marinifaba aquimaris TaxID=2741323 RepID=UPI001571E24B|nr:TIGR03087 family PEP-CTERM/XrtA system glycosyltransferase [Marinifaba aquimaris]NTS75955.1 TIGR03087 family PEP-CTERM/XrtA system glycosyltransferase [Marinifaba aquimaris]
MEALLFLSHRIPYPPNKGDKIRSFNILKFLSERYSIHLGTFIDDPNDFQYQASLDEFTASKTCLPLSRSAVSQAKGAAKAFIEQKPITLPCFYSEEMSNWVEQTIEQHDIKKVFIFCSSMAQYVEGEKYQGLDRIIDFVDIDSDKWRQYAENKPFPMSAVYNREYKTLAKYENKIAEQFTNSLFVSPDEAEQFKKQINACFGDKVHPILNGVDTKFFDPTIELTCEEYPDLHEQKFIVFTGAMDYWANEEAVLWFAENIWPQLESKYQNTKFYIVGGNPSETIKNLSKKYDNVVVTGRVHDIRPYIKHASLCIAPLRIARGIQNKVLEAMAMSKPVVMTQMAAEGIEFPQEQLDFISDDSGQFLNAIEKLIEDTNHTKSIGIQNLEWIKAHYQWRAVLQPLLSYINTDS